MPCGYGEVHLGRVKFSGTWLNGERHGISRLDSLMTILWLGIETIWRSGNILVSECRNGKPHGPFTRYGKE